MPFALGSWYVGLELERSLDRLGPVAASPTTSAAGAGCA